MRDRLRAGVAVYNDGHYHAAHDAWEDRWLDLESGTDDERLLHGLIQFTAAIHHARGRNWEGAVGLATSARDYLAGLPAGYRGIDVAAVREALDELGSDPEVVERWAPPTLTHEGEPLGLADLDPREAAVAAAVLAEELGYDEEPVERAGAYARADLEAGREGSRFVALVYDFLLEEEDRGLVYRRLREHVERRRAKEEDVAGLFDERERTGTRDERR